MSDFTSLNGYMVKDAELQAGIDELKQIAGYDDVIGLQADFENNTFTRLCAAKGLEQGSDFDRFSMYGNRKVCALQDDGTVSKWYGDTGYVEDGSIGQIMVRQPKFYYKVVPITIAPIEPDDTDQTDTKGYYLKKVNYYISDKPLAGFKVHPAFIDASGNEKDCYYIGAYEASLHDVSESKYLQYDSWSVTESGGVYTINALNTYLADAANDKLCSIAGVKPASGEYSTQFTRPNVNQMAKNRGMGWGAVNVKIASAEQLLQIIELGQFNVQNAIANGVMSYASGDHNESVFTGSTSTLGNGTGAAASSSRLVSNGTYETNTNDGYKSIRYRGVENFWGNVWSYISGINVWGNGKMGGGQAYIADDFNFAESKNSDNYKPVGFTLPYRNGTYYKYLGYSTTHDWIFLPAGTTAGTSSVPIGDALYSSNKLNTYRIAYLGGAWYAGARAGSFYWYVAAAVGHRHRSIGGRLALV